MECLDENPVDWDQKVGKAYFRGALSGRGVDRMTGESYDRIKLVHLADKQPELLEVELTDLGDLGASDLPESNNKVIQDRLDSCQTNHKYMIVIDGDSSSWTRGPLALYSSAVPLVVESRFTPLYQKSWLPWIHYVPINNDLSDLADQIKWL